MLHSNKYIHTFVCARSINIRCRSVQLRMHCHRKIITLYAIVCEMLLRIAADPHHCTGRTRYDDYTRGLHSAMFCCRSFVSAVSLEVAVFFFFVFFFIGSRAWAGKIGRRRFSPTPASLGRWNFWTFLSLDISCAVRSKVST